MKRAVLIFALIVPAFAGCRATDERAAAEAEGVPVAECPVCKAEGDLACLRVKVGPHTPNAEYQGRTYWFCSEECRAEFLKRPDRFLAH